MQNNRKPSAACLRSASASSSQARAASSAHASPIQKQV